MPPDPAKTCPRQHDIDVQDAAIVAAARAALAQLVGYRRRKRVLAHAAELVPLPALGIRPVR